jgi:predicted glutamine amidotransferase
MLAVTQQTSNISEILKNFGALADCGCVPSGVSSGHRDGWGIAAIRAGKLSKLVKSTKEADVDAKFTRTVFSPEVKEADLLIAHLRKASKGGKAIKNNHPFHSGKFIFCHNGYMHEIEKIRLAPKFAKKIKGTTDSERFFYYILQFLAKPEVGSVRNALTNAVRHVRKHHDYKSLNFIFSNGEKVWAMREVNRSNTEVKQKNAFPYYSLFVGSMRNGSLRFVASEKFKARNVAWRPFRNHEFLEIDVATGKIKSIIV